MARNAILSVSKVCVYFYTYTYQKRIYRYIYIYTCIYTYTATATSQEDGMITSVIPEASRVNPTPRGLESSFSSRRLVTRISSTTFRSDLGSCLEGPTLRGCGYIEGQGSFLGGAEDLVSSYKQGPKWVKS